MIKHCKNTNTRLLCQKTTFTACVSEAIPQKTGASKTQLSPPHQNMTQAGFGWGSAGDNALHRCPWWLTESRRSWWRISPGFSLRCVLELGFGVMLLFLLLCLRQWASPTASQGAFPAVCSPQSAALFAYGIPPCTLCCPVCSPKLLPLCSAENHIRELNSPK